MKIIGIPALVGTYDNYIWLLHDKKNAWVIDPGESQAVIDFLETQALQLQGILITHFHFDHVDGIPALKQYAPKAQVYGPEKTQNPYIQTRLTQDNKITLTDNFALTVLNTPGHTDDHISYYNANVLFCGDTLFTAGCGRKFNSDFEAFTESVLKLRNLPDDLAFYSAHEYTQDNLAFASWVEPNNTQLQQRIKNEVIHYPKIQENAPSFLGLEKATNPFLRFDTPALIKQLEARGADKNSKISLFQTLREWKDEIDQNGFPA